ncbi:ATP-binding protein [Desulfococcaceae bacterium HSG7]|nr:ATP-binding protein [Desulfococcaceae bacterium HSG7]
MNFLSEEDNLQKPPVTIITGENGTGKTIIMDALRGMLFGSASQLERNIIRNENDFSVSLEFNAGNKKERLSSSESAGKNQFRLNSPDLAKRFMLNQQPDATWNWVIDYWTSQLSAGSFEVKNLVAPIAENIYTNALDGIQKNVETAQLICFFDYLRTSK